MTVAPRIAFDTALPLMHAERAMDECDDHATALEHVRRDINEYARLRALADHIGNRGLAAMMREEEWDRRDALVLLLLAPITDAEIEGAASLDRIGSWSQ